MTDKQTLQQILAELKRHSQEQQDILQKLAQVEKPIWVQDGKKKKILRIPDIAFITTNARGLDIYTIDGQNHINFDSISNVIEQFKDDPRLMQTHRSYIVNLNNIDTVHVVSGGRDLTFKGLPTKLKARITYDYLEAFEKRFGKA